jgi:tetratricopeptide (TPR) repeat protein
VLDGGGADFVRGTAVAVAERFLAGTGYPPAAVEDLAGQLCRSAGVDLHGGSSWSGEFSAAANGGASSSSTLSSSPWSAEFAATADAPRLGIETHRHPHHHRPAPPPPFPLPLHDQHQHQYQHQYQQQQHQQQQQQEGSHHEGPQQEGPQQQQQQQQGPDEQHISNQQADPVVADGDSVQILRDLARDPAISGTEFNTYLQGLANDLSTDDAGGTSAGERWAREFSATQDGDWGRLESEFAASRGAHADANSSNTATATAAAWADGFAAYVDTVAPDRNSFAADEHPFERGMELFADSRHPQAAEAFEAAVARDPTHTAAWVQLGLVHAEADNEPLAIRALRRAIEIDPVNLAALTHLATSYTNEGEVIRAVECLESYIMHSPALRDLYAAHVMVEPDVLPPRAEDAAAATTTTTTTAATPRLLPFRERHARCVAMYIEAANRGAALASDGAADPGIQSALGVLFNLSGDYDRAIDCFRTAVAENPGDHLLWNKLGASLANSAPSRSEEAAVAYGRALEAKPLYPRAIVNLGISYTNRGMHRDAAEHYLGVLRLSPGSVHLWDLARMAFKAMNRPDLERKCAARNVDAFAPEFSFVPVK